MKYISKQKMNVIANNIKLMVYKVAKLPIEENKLVFDNQTRLAKKWKRKGTK